MKPLRRALFLAFVFTGGLWANDTLEWNKLPALPSELGVAGPFTGVHGNTLIVGGGANFPKPVWESDKVWHDAVYALKLDDDQPAWETAGTLPRPLGYGACVSVPEGIVCIGGNDAGKVYPDVFLLSWDGGELSVEELPALPKPLCYGAATLLNNAIYVAGGTTGLGLETAQRKLWRLDWSQRGNADAFQWEELEAWPGPERGFNTLVAQSNGREDCLYLIGGRRIDGKGQIEMLRDVYEFAPLRRDSPWRRRADLPQPRAAGTAVPIGRGHIFVLSGDDGSLFDKIDELKDDHPGFPKKIFAYHTITDTWVEAGEMPQNQVTTHAVPWDDRFLLVSGEVRPRVRTRDVWQLEAIGRPASFAPANWASIVIYLGAVMGIGFFFSRRNKNTDDFFRGGQRVPAWVAGLSIFATMLSSITFIALPARAFAADWTYIVINAGILVCAPLVVFGIIPYFRRNNATSAYEYLEQRFNLPIRLFASTSFLLFQIGRMAIVMYLPALVLAAITPVSLEGCILLMGVLSIIYSTMGGLEAVVWTDALQAIVLIGGALLCFGIMVAGLDGGISDLSAIAAADQKLQWADFDWSATSYMTTAFWVMVLGGLGSALIPYTSDQSVVQRYVSTRTEGKARSAVWLNTGMSVVATVLFFALGTALYAFYKTHPESLDPTFGPDSVFPLFISRELPIGIAGIVVAAVFAAAQSTISTSMNSASTVIVTDFFRRLGWQSSEQGYLRLARLLTVILGSLGTLFALILAWGGIESAWETFLSIIGFVMGPLCGIFLLGMFTKSANSRGAAAAAVAGVAVLVSVKYLTQTNGLLYAPIGIATSFAVGLTVSQLGGNSKTQKTRKS